MTLMQSIDALPEGWEVASIVLTPAHAPPGCSVVVQSRPGSPHAALDNDLQALTAAMPGFSLVRRSPAGEVMPWSECTLTQSSVVGPAREVTVHQLMVMVPRRDHSLAITGTASAPESFAQVRAHTFELAERLRG